MTSKSSERLGYHDGFATNPEHRFYDVEGFLIQPGWLQEPFGCVWKFSADASGLPIVGGMACRYPDDGSRREFICRSASNDSVVWEEIKAEEVRK